MNQVTENFLNYIFECEYKILSQNSVIEVSRAILHKDNLVKALIEVYGEDGYKKLREELVCR